MTVKPVDLSNLPLLCQYLDEFDKATEATLKLGDVAEAYNYYFEQLGQIQKQHPTWQFQLELSSKHSAILSYFYSEGKIMAEKREYERYLKGGY